MKKFENAKCPHCNKPLYIAIEMITNTNHVRKFIVKKTHNDVVKEIERVVYQR